MEAKRLKAEKLKKLRSEGVEIKSEDEKTEDNLPMEEPNPGNGCDDGIPTSIRRNGECRALPWRWTMSEHGMLVQTLKAEGKIVKGGKLWKDVATAIGTKNEQ